MIFLLGGNGFVGSGFARIMRMRGQPFEIISRENYSDFVGKHCDVFINANGNSKKFLGKDDPKSEFQASVTSVRNSLVDFKFNTYVYLSTSDIYPDCSRPDLTREGADVDVAKQSPYGFHKYLAEQCVRHAAKRYLIIRQGGFVGPGMKKNSVYDVMHGDKIWVNPDSRFQFINTDDSASAILGLLAQGISNEIVNVTGLGTISVAELMNLFGRHLPGPDNMTPIQCEISLEKASAWIDLPETMISVRRYFESLRR